MDTHAGWYPDPSGAPTQRFWDGQRWTAATAVLAAPMLVAIPAPAPQSFSAHHPWLTRLGIVWVVLLALHWWWLAPLLIIAFLLHRGVRYARLWAADRRRENARISAEADYENRLYLQGDARGTYGKYRPANPAS